MKYNLKRRRKGLKDISYVEFEEALSKREHRKIRKDSDAGYYYRKGAFYLVQHCYLKGGVQLLRAFTTRPEYVFQKLKSGFVQ